MVVSTPPLKVFKQSLMAEMQYRKWIGELGRKLELVMSLAPSKAEVSWL